MRIKTESEILKIEVRKQIIDEMESYEEKDRKNESYRRYQCYKDKTVRYVIENLLHMLDQSTVSEMRYSLSNINITKKVIDKLARVYNYGVKREIAKDETATQAIQQLEKTLCINTAMKKTNRFLKLQRNLAFYVKPCMVYNSDGSSYKWSISLEALNPHLYSAVENYYDRTKPLAHVLSNYKPVYENSAVLDPGVRSSSVQVKSSGNNFDEKIADSPADQNQGEPKQYIWWSDSYHFTTDQNGEIISIEGNEKNENPFGISPVINFAIDQDGAFWATGGDDLIDGAILINSMISHNNHVGIVQGYGQFWMSGENLPRAIKVGPTKAILMEYKKDEQAEPKAGFLSANPQLDSLRGNVEAYLALLLTTNNLSTSGISTQLSSGLALPSGIALLIDKAESLEDVADQRQLFIDKEPVIWTVIGKILDTYRGDLVPELDGLALPEDIKNTLNLSFGDPSTIVTEKEKLENMKLRQELGLDSMISLLMKDDPSLTEEMAEEKLKKILEANIKQKMLESQVQKELGIEVETPQERDANATMLMPPEDMNESNQDDNNKE